jgi:hypothetical protein
VHEEHLGSNFYLSEYDNVDRRILYQKERCTGSGIEVVPLTVTHYACNNKWIIAKSVVSGDSIQHWIIDKDFDLDGKPDRYKSREDLKYSIVGPLDSAEFTFVAKQRGISLVLQEI